jgi:Tfp pilus assembly protein PilX
LEQLQRKRDVDHAMATRLAEALLLTFEHWINTDEATETASALAAWKGVQS